MSFDDEIRDSLSAAASAHDPGPPPLDEFAAKVRRRQRAKKSGAGVLAVAGLAVVISLVGALANPSSPKNTLHAADQRGGDTNVVGPSSTDGVGQTSTSRATAGGTVALSGTAYAPPTTMVSPSTTNTTAHNGSTTTTPPTSGDTVTVTQADDGKTFTLSRGQHLVVTLDDPSWQWSDPDTDNAKVLARTAVSANPSSTHVTASFDAKTNGQAHVSASKDAPCRYAQPPCMVPTYLWQITVNVV